MAAITADLSAPEALTVYKIVDTKARNYREHGDERTLDQLRADIFVDHFTNPQRHVNPEANLTTDADADADADDPDQETDQDTGRSGDLNPNPDPDADPDADTTWSEDEPDQDDQATEDEDENKDENEPTKATTNPGPGRFTEHTDHEPDTDQVPNTDHAPDTDHEPDADGRWASNPGPGTPAGSRAQRRAETRMARRAKSRDRRRKPKHRCPKAHINVTVSFDTLLGLSDEPGDLGGYGAIPADLARAIANDPDSTWRRLVTDPLTGQLLDYGRTKYRPPKPLADHVRARDVTCSHCGAPAEKCDLDHVVPYPYGDTSDRNLRCKCRRGHRLKHEGGWRDQPSTNPNDPAGTFTTTSPTGHEYTRQPPAIGSIHQPPPPPNGDGPHPNSGPIASDGTAAPNPAKSSGRPDPGTPPF
jgi:hypothetical protein